MEISLPAFREKYGVAMWVPIHFAVPPRRPAMPMEIGVAASPPTKMRRAMIMMPAPVVKPVTLAFARNRLLTSLVLHPINVTMPEFATPLVEHAPTRQRQIALPATTATCVPRGMNAGKASVSDPIW